MSPVLVIAIAAGSIWLLSSMSKGSGTTSYVDPTGFLDHFFDWLWEEEGGLAYGTIAGDADLPRAPVGANSQGIFPHTSRGITVPTIEFYYGSKNKSVDWQEWLNFSLLDEPNDLWKDVTTYRGRQSLNYTSQPVLQRYISLWYFGGWDQDLVSIAQVKDILSSSDSNKQKLRQLVNLRKFYFDELARLGRATQSTAQHWKERAEDFYNDFSIYLT